MRTYRPTPEQRAAMDRAKGPQRHPLRSWQRSPSGDEEKQRSERVAPAYTRLVRR